ncbi:MAG TPA: ABC transporter permease [Candidatus Hydrothermia bacterium]|nr:ABC transporter permease [Candidatus Hydrothermae bacterium]MDD3649744.1 ABC transporter permease [Candidatus Hydrothermia bacterium]MDD5572645.1 ABC transporter permease [Candidatus Hydrothermia bacterium]HOK23634.1 ABC transporter permease [Candidatus Hydrothermia bacterium]HOL24385.1 ABC transporter permease [Candidatus Hydrothermia bacterium]
MYVLKAEILKFWYDLKRYKFNYLIGLLATFIFLTGIYRGVTSSSEESGNATTFIGLILWIFAARCISDASDNLFEERYYGTIEQISVTRFSLPNIFMARFFVDLLFAVIRIFFIGLPMFILFSPKIGIFFTTLENSIITTIVIISIIITLYGFGLLLAALGFMFLRIGSFSSVFQYLILFFSGIVIPYESMPQPLRAFSNLLPMGLGIRVLSGIEKNMLLFKEILLTILYSILIFTVAVITFKKSVRHVKQTGKYSAY